MIRGTHLLVGLHERFQMAARYALQVFDEAGLEPIVTEGVRSPERQAQLYAQGRTSPGQIVTNARPWESAHQYGLAIDVTVRAGYGSAQQREVHRLFAALGFGVVTNDLPHGEHPAFRAWLRQSRK